MKAYARPMMVTGFGLETEQVSALEPLPLGLKAGSELAYSEAWLQALIQRHPTLLPIEAIEPALTPLVAVCTELPLPSGYADNLMLTPAGGIVLVETKLWRNPQARREVVGQVLDYAKDLAGLSYEALEQAVRKARQEPKASLFDLVCGAEGGSEAQFHDAVSRNLRQGRVLLLIAGDGVQEGAEQLVSFLQRHMGLHFTLALVEIALWRLPGTDQVFVQPKVLARTVQIERAVVRLEEGVALQPASIAPASPTAKPATLSSEAYYEALAKAGSDLPARLQAFLARAEALGAYATFGRGLSLKWNSPDGRSFQLGVIDASGCLATDYVNWSANSIGRLDLSQAYEARLAALIPGAVVRKTPTPANWRLIVAGKNPSIRPLLDHEDAWLAAISDYVTALGQALASASEGEGP